MNHIFKKRSFHFFLKSLSPFSPPNPNPNFINYNQQIRLIRSIPPLISNLSCFNGASYRNLSTRLSEPNNKPNNKTILLPGCDLVHWLVVVDQPDLNLTRDEVIDGYIKTLAAVVGSEEEARMKIYSVSTKHYFAFGALVSEALAYKLKELSHVRWVLPDSYLDVKNQTYAGEPFINGQAVPYDSKYHAIWLRNREESLKSSMRNKRKQSDSNSSRPRQNSPPSPASTSAFQSQTRHSTQMKNHSMPSNQATSKQCTSVWSDPNQTLEPGLGYQSQLSEPRISNNGNLYNNLPPLSSGNNRASYMENSNFRGDQAQQHNHYKNIPHGVPQNYQPDQSSYRNTLSSNAMVSPHGNWNYQKESLTPSHMWDSLPSHNVNSGFQGRVMPSHNVNPGFQGQDMPSHDANLGFQGQDIPSHNANPGFQGRDIPSHNANLGFQGQDMPHHIVDRGFQGNDIPSHNANLGFQGQGMLSHSANTGFEGQEVPSSNVNPGSQGQNMASHSVNPGFPVRDMPSHIENLGFRGQEMLSHNVNQGFHEQEMTYPHQQSGYSYRGFSGDARNGNYHNSYPSTVPQHRQSQNRYVDLHSSNTTVSSLGAWSRQNANMTSAPPRDMPSQMQKPGIHRPDDLHSGTSPHQHQSMYVEFQGSNATGSHPIENYCNTNAFVQDSRFSNANMMPHVLNHYQGADMSQPIQNSEHQRDVRQAAKQVDSGNEGTLPTIQPRDYQERDVPSDD